MGIYTRTFTVVDCDGCHSADAYDNSNFDGVPVFTDDEQARAELEPQGWTFANDGGVTCPGCKPTTTENGDPA